MCASTQRYIVPILLIVERESSPIKIIVEPSSSNNVTSGDCICADYSIRFTIIRKFCIGLMLFKKSLSDGIMAGYCQFQIRCEFLNEMKLIMGLMIIIYLIFVGIIIIGTPRIQQVLGLVFAVAFICSVSQHSIHIVINARLRRAVPTLIGAFLSGKCNGLYNCFLSVISTGKIVAAQIARGSVNISVASNFREPAFHGKAIF